MLSESYFIEQRFCYSPSSEPTKYSENSSIAISASERIEFWNLSGQWPVEQDIHEPHHEPFVWLEDSDILGLLNKEVTPTPFNVTHAQSCKELRMFEFMVACLQRNYATRSS